MSLKLVQMYFLVAIVTVLGQRAMAQSGCSSTIMGLAPCLGYIQGSSSNPTSSCCTQLASVVQSQPRCLCSLLNGGGSQFGVAINQTLALALPGVCNVQTPPISRCNGANQPSGPTASPAGSPVGSPADALTPDGSIQPTFSGIPSGTNSKTVPSANGSTSDGNTIIRIVLSLISLILPKLRLTGTNSKTVPSANGSTSDGNTIIRMPLHLTIFLLFITSIAATTLKI